MTQAEKDRAVPAGYRELRAGETTRVGDRWWVYPRSWEKVGPHGAGKEVGRYPTPASPNRYIRRIEE